MKRRTEVEWRLAMASEPPLMSVVVVVSGRCDVLERCLEAIKAQAGTSPIETIVPYDDAVAHIVDLSDRFPNVRFVRAFKLDSRAGRVGRSDARLDRLRAIGLRESRGYFVAMTEDHAVTSPTWCVDFMIEHYDHQRAGAVGGAIECASEGLLARAVYYCDFGRYQNPLRDGLSAFVSEANVAYRRPAIWAVHDTWAERFCEPDVHGALAAKGYELRLTSKAVASQARVGLTWGSAVRERVVWGRAHAGARARKGIADP